MGLSYNWDRAHYNFYTPTQSLYHYKLGKGHGRGTAFSNAGIERCVEGGDTNMRHMFKQGVYTHVVISHCVSNNYPHGAWHTFQQRGAIVAKQLQAKPK